MNELIDIKAQGETCNRLLRAAIKQAHDEGALAEVISICTVRMAALVSIELGYDLTSFMEFAQHEYLRVREKQS